MRKPDMTGVVLAGGRSKRFGQNKAFLTLCGRPLIELILEQLKSLFQDLMISSNDAANFGGFGIPVVPDEFKNGGALAGIHACLKASKHEFVFFVACDMPFLNIRLIEKMKSMTDGYDVVIPESSRGLEPLYAIYSKKCIAPIEKHLAGGNCKIVDFFPEVTVRIVRESDVDVTDFEEAFFNVNTPGDYERMLEKKYAHAARSVTS